MEKIILNSDDEQNIELYVIDQTRLNGINYLLVTDTEDEEADAEAYILKDMSKDSDAEALYEFVEEDAELEAVSKIFSELIDDTEINI